MKRLIFATGNQNKMREIREILADLPVEILSMKEAGIEVLCLDECHHLRSEWWKALEDFKKQVDNLKII